jgi:hypothetical protein
MAGLDFSDMEGWGEFESFLNDVGEDVDAAMGA